MVGRSSEPANPEGQLRRFSRRAGRSSRCPEGRSVSCSYSLPASVIQSSGRCVEKSVSRGVGAPFRSPGRMSCVPVAFC